MLTLFLLSLVTAQFNGVNQIKPFPMVLFCQQSGAGEATGQQQPNGGNMCVSTPQGLIPEVGKMVTTLITSPPSSSTVNADQGFCLQFQTNNMMSGLSADLTTQFLMVPQTLDSNTGMVQGFMQVVVQKIDDPALAPDAKEVQFFASTVDTKSDSNGVTKYKVDVPPGLIKTRGLHRLCTVAASASGQPVIMPVAQRGPQDDCIRLNIV
jgi:hypothetical protein